MHQRVGRAFILSLAGVAALSVSFADGQLATGYHPMEPPSIREVRIHPSALAPNLRKWYLPQSLYYEYRWRGWEYSNYAREQYQRYVGIQLEGTAQYDPLGNYISRGWRIYDWTESNPDPLGSSILKNPQFSSWFNNVIVSSARKGQFHMALTIGDGIRTTMTPLTFSKPSFNGMQWDFLSDKYGATILASRVNSPAIPVNFIGMAPTTGDNSTRLLGFRGLSQVGDFGRAGITWINAHHAHSELSLEKNSLKGVLTEPQNIGNVGKVVIRISDDSPESPESGAVLFLESVIVDGDLHEEVVPLIEGGINESGVLHARGSDQILLTYDLKNDFRPTEEVPTFRDAKKLEFELIVANDYSIEVSSNKQTDRLGGLVFLPVQQARGNVIDGSNQRFIKFEYGLPTANEVISVDFELTNIAGLDLRMEYAVNRRFSRYPNQNFRKLPVIKETADAGYVTASYVSYPWFVYGEGFNMDPDYSTTAFIGDLAGEIDYDNVTRNLFEFVDDNDDQDRFADWARSNQSGQNIFLGQRGGSAGRDTEVFPGLDENNDFISDFNQNRNSIPDYAEPFLRYRVDQPEFLFGMDLNNNNIIDRFEDDVEPDYPYQRDRRGYNVYGGAALTQDVSLTLGRLHQRQQSSGRKNRMLYTLLTAQWNYPGLRLSLFEHLKTVKDDIPDDKQLWRELDGTELVRDPMDHLDTVVNALYLNAHYFRITNLNIINTLRYDHFFQRGDESDLKRNRRFLGLINKVDYKKPIGPTLTLWPKWKSTLRMEVPSKRGSRTQRNVEETLFLIGRYSFMEGTWIDLGYELSFFENLKKTPELAQADFVDDFRSTVFSILLSNSGPYLGYELTLNAGFQRERQKFEEATNKESIAFVRVFAATGE